MQGAAIATILQFTEYFNPLNKILMSTTYWFIINCAKSLHLIDKKTKQLQVMAFISYLWYSIVFI